jgi:hypothetical protein
MVPFGVVTRGEVEPVEGDPIVTQFLMLAWIPMIPVASFYGAETADETGFVGKRMGLVHEEVSGIQRTLHGRSVLMGYFRGIGTVLCAIGVPILMMQLGERPAWSADVTKGVIAAMVAIIVAIFVSFRLGARVAARDHAIRRASKVALGIAADLAHVPADDAKKHRNRLEGGGQPSSFRAAIETAAPGGALEMALVRLRLEMVLSPEKRDELEDLTDRALSRLTA